MGIKTRFNLCPGKIPTDSPYKVSASHRHIPTNPHCWYGDCPEGHVQTLGYNNGQGIELEAAHAGDQNKSYQGHRSARKPRGINMGSKPKGYASDLPSSDRTNDYIWLLSMVERHGKGGRIHKADNRHPQQPPAESSKTNFGRMQSYIGTSTGRGTTSTTDGSANLETQCRINKQAPQHTRHPWYGKVLKGGLEA